jgi:hypothetical protein
VAAAAWEAVVGCTVAAAVEARVAVEEVRVVVVADPMAAAAVAVEAAAVAAADRTTKTQGDSVAPRRFARP